MRRGGRGCKRPRCRCRSRRRGRVRAELFVAECFDEVAGGFTASLDDQAGAVRRSTLGWRWCLCLCGGGEPVGGALDGCGGLGVGVGEGAGGNGEDGVEKRPVVEPVRWRSLVQAHRKAILAGD
jgi:hypothetical protein